MPSISLFFIQGDVAHLAPVDMAVSEDSTIYDLILRVCEILKVLPCFIELWKVSRCSIA